jgi:dipeptidyl aminopeptidase/acylaminoacyl peptidase
VTIPEPRVEPNGELTRSSRSHRPLQAASAGRRATNWISMYAQSDVRTYRSGTPWQKGAPIDAYWNNSPLKDVGNAKTPNVF